MVMVFWGRSFLLYAVFVTRSELASSGALFGFRCVVASIIIGSLGDARLGVSGYTPAVVACHTCCLLGLWLWARWEKGKGEWEGVMRDDEVDRIMYKCTVLH
jgi:hypothetical protein